MLQKERDAQKYRPFFFIKGGIVHFTSPPLSTYKDARIKYARKPSAAMLKLKKKGAEAWDPACALMQPSPASQVVVILLETSSFSSEGRRVRSSTHYRFRSACACRHAASPLNAERLKEARSLQPRRGDDAPGSWSSLTSVAARSSWPPSRSWWSQGIGIADEGESLMVSAAWAWMSSVLVTGTSS